MTARSRRAMPATSPIRWRRGAPGATGRTRPAAPIWSRIIPSTTPTSHGGRSDRGTIMHKVKLTIATTDYDHFRDFRTGAVQAEGIEHTWLTLGHHEIFSRFTFNREWDVTELSFAKFTAQVTRENSGHHRPAGVRLAPVPLRLVLRQQARAGSRPRPTSRARPSARPNGRTPPPSTCAAGSHNEAGVKLQDVHWYQAGANEAGRIEKVELDLPAGVQLTRVADKSLSEHARGGRDRLRADRAAADLLSRGPSRRGAPVSRFPRTRGAPFRATPRCSRSCTSSR